MKIIFIADNQSGKEPFLFLKPDSALQKNNKPFFIPDFTRCVTVSLHPVIRISKLGKNIAERFASRYYDAITVGVDITAEDIRQRCIEHRLPWEECNSFDGSAVIGDFIPKEHFDSLSKLHLKLECDGRSIQQFSVSQLLRSADSLIAWVSQFYTMKTGDLIYMGTFSTTEIHIGERLQGYLEEDCLFDFHIR